MKIFDDTLTFAGGAKKEMAGFIIKEYQIYCKNYKNCHSWDILTANTSEIDASNAALKRGWEKDSGLWICPKCLAKMKKQ